jgi:hypothetical protein
MENVDVMKWLSRRINDGRILRLLKMSLETAVKARKGTCNAAAAGDWR